MRLRQVGAGAPRKGDQFFSLEQIGTLNVSKIHRWVVRNPANFEFRTTPITQELVDYIWRCHDPDRRRLAEMGLVDVQNGFATCLDMAADAEEPRLQIIDGNHYVLKSWEFGLTEARVVVVPKRLLNHFLFFFEAQESRHGPWRRLPTTEILDRIQGLYAGRDGAIRDADGTIVEGNPLAT